MQYSPAADSVLLLDAKDLARVQLIVSIFLYYGISVDNTILVALGSIAGQQVKATSSTMAAANILLYYTTTNLIAKIRYHASDMQLYTHSNLSYLSEPKARSQGAGFFLSNRPSNPNLPTSKHTPPLNGALHILCKIIRNFMR